MKVQLSLRASDLKNVAGIGRGTSDPFAVVTHMDTTSTVLGKTETIKNTLDPDWAKAFVFDYELGTPMRVAVSLYDEVRKGENISMGSVLFDIGSLLGAYGNTKGKKIKRGGVVFARVGKFEENGTMRLKLKGIKLKNTEGFLRKSDPFFELKMREDSDSVGTSWDSVFRSKTVKDNLSPLWSDAVVSLGTLCNGNMDRPIKICVYDYESSGEHVLMGELETTVNKLVLAKEEEEDGALSLHKKGSETGKIVVLKADIYGVENLSDDMAAASVSDDGARSSIKAKTPTFIEYISGGCELNLCVAIDFTGSNGDPRIPGTLHFRHADGAKNDYEKAISAIGGILEKYDSNKKFPVWGFGAKYGGVVRHCFQCGPIQEVDGVGGVLSAYQEVFRSGLIMSGPTVFTEVILTSAKKAADAQVAAEKEGKHAYSILLIITDGSVSDVNATAEALAAASASPLSIVIVGVGEADFSSMVFLDEAKSEGGRDIAQFVEFNAHSHSPQSLTSATLQEIPNQLVEFFTSHGQFPNATVHANEDEIVVEAEEEEIDLSLDFGDDAEITVSGGEPFSRNVF